MWKCGKCGNVMNEKNTMPSMNSHIFTFPYFHISIFSHFHISTFSTKRYLAKRLYFIVAAAFFISCNEARYLEQGQYLYDGADVKINSLGKTSKSKRKALKSEMEGLLRPKPNGKILGVRFKLWVYNIAGTPKGKGLRYWLKNKVGEPPVLASMPAFEKNRAVLQNRLENRGYFKDTVSMDTAARKKRVHVTYTATIGDQYTIRKVSFPNDSSTLGKEIGRITARRSRLMPGRPYDLDVIKAERERIDSRLKQRGFYYFNPDYLLALVDSTVGDHQVDIRMIVKKSTPEEAKEVYAINDVIVFTDYDVDSDTSMPGQKPVLYQGYKIIDPEKKFKPIIFSRALVFKPGDIYNRRDHDLSLNRLINLGVFKFVKVRFEEPDSMENKLNAFYYLTPTEKKSIRFEVSGFTKSDNANGGQLGVTWRNRNFFRGAELFTANIYGGLERQFITKSQTISTNKAGIDINLYFPRIIAPFSFQTNSGFMPKTRINLGYELFDRSSQYRLNSLKTSFGYIWKESAQKEHQLNLININYVDPSKITPEFQQQLDTNLTLARSIEKQFIIGPSYNFNLNTQINSNRRRNNFYFNANLDLSGNILGLITGADVQHGKERTIFNTPFSQYIRGELDFRHYLGFSRYTVLASRITGGLGYAWGNSVTMPFIKEFFAGGANDLRAFRARSLGPGTYYAGNRDTAFLPDQPGDIKLEMNAELRFKLFSVVHWAFFADAGNIWTLRTDSSRPGSKFTSQFLDQVAIGVGTGLRLDISILVLRLDIAVPVREPYLPKGAKWVFDNKNLVWNLAIGYPF